MKTKETKQLNKVERFERIKELAINEYHNVLWTVANDDKYETLEYRMRDFKTYVHLLKCFALMRGKYDPVYWVYSKIRWDE